MSFTNIGTIDRIVRVVLGVILLSLIFVGPKSQWGALGLILIATAVIQWCPAYFIANFSTCNSPTNKEKRK